MDEESSKAQSENSLVRKTSLMPELKELRSALDAGIERTRNGVEADNKRIDDLLVFWEDFEKKVPKDASPAFEHLWMVFAKLSKYVLGRDKSANKLLVVNE